MSSSAGTKVEPGVLAKGSRRAFAKCPRPYSEDKRLFGGVHSSLVIVIAAVALISTLSAGVAYGSLQAVGVTPPTGLVVASSSPTVPSVVSTVELPLGSDPNAIAYVSPVSPGGSGSVWVLDPGTSNVSVIDDGSDEVIATIPIPSVSASSHGIPCTDDVDPSAIAADPALGEVFVGSAVVCSPDPPGIIDVFSASSYALLATISVGASLTYPNFIVYDSGAAEMFVTSIDGGADSVSVISTSSDTVTANLAFYSTTYLGGLAYDLSLGEVFVGTESAGPVYATDVISDSTNAVVATIPGVVGSMTYDSGLGEIFAANYATDAVSVVSDSSNAVTATIGVGEGPEGAAYDPAYGGVFVANFVSGDSPGTVSVISDASDTVTATVSVGNGPEGITFDPGTGQVFVENWGSDSVSVIGVPPGLVLTPNTDPTGTSTVLSGGGYAPEYTYDYCFESGVTSSPTACSSVDQFTTTSEGYIPTATALTVNGETGLVVVSDPSSALVVAFAEFTVGLSIPTSVISCLPTSVAPSSTCTVTLTGESGSISGETVYWGQYLEPGSVSFSSSTCTLSGSPESCSVGLTAAVSGADMLWTEYVGDSNNQLSYGGLSLSVSTTPPPVIALAPTQGPVGTTYVVAGSGFSVSSSATISFNGVDQAPTGGSDCSYAGTSITTDGSGQFTCTFAVPTESSSTYDVVGDDEATGTLTVAQTFMVTSPTIAIFDESTSSATYGSVGDPATLTATGLAPTTAYEIYFDAEPMSEDNFATSFTSLADGSYSGSFNIPSVAEGSGSYYVDAFEEVSENFITTTSSPFTVSEATLTLTPSAGPSGTTVTVTGSGFPSPSESVELDVAGPVAESTICALDSGSIAGTCSFVASPSAGAQFAFSVGGSPIPITATSEACGQKGCGYFGPSATATFTGTVASATISPGSGPVGAEVTLTGAGLAPTTGYAIYFDSSQGTPGTAVTPNNCMDSGGLSGSTITSDSSGSFSCTANVPVALVGEEGPYFVDVFEAVSANFITSVTTPASGQFTVSEPTIALEPSHGPAGTLYTVTGSGFSGASGVTVSFNGAVQTPSGCSDGSSVGSVITTDASGGFVCVFSVPNEVAGAYSVAGTDMATAAVTATQTFDVTISLTTNPSGGPPGTTVTAYGSGFAADSSTSVTFYEANNEGTFTVCQATTDALGAFSCTFLVPAPIDMQYGYTGAVTVGAKDASGDSAIASFALSLPYPVYLLSLKPGSSHSLGVVTEDGKFGFLLDDWSLSGAHTIAVTMDYATGTYGSQRVINAYLLGERLSLNLYGIGSGPSLFLDLGSTSSAGCTITTLSEVEQPNGDVIISATFDCTTLTFSLDNAVPASSASPPYFLFQAAGIKSPTTNGEAGFLLSSWDFSPAHKGKSTLEVSMSYAGAKGTDEAFFDAFLHSKVLSSVDSWYFVTTTQFDFELKATNAVMTTFLESGQPGSLPVLSMEFTFTKFTYIDS